MKTHFLGVDTGGTFTDFVYVSDGNVRVHKVLSTPANPQEAILRGIEELGLISLVNAGDVQIVHGTTVATNAALEGKGVRTAYITNQGMGDILRIGRQIRPNLYELQVTGSQPAVAQSFEVNTRLDATGKVIREPKDAELRQLIKDVDDADPEAIAINFLFSFLDDSMEREIEKLFNNRYFVSRSSFVLAEYGEYERGIATYINASLGPLMQHYLEDLNQSVAPSKLAIMQSSGVTIAADQAAQRAVNLLLSGPVGGLRATERVVGNRAMTFDMGGTSTDVSLLDGGITLTNEGAIAGFPIAIPMADIHTIGAGGGSIAWIDQGGLLQVGPRSAGADPGPACYGNGGRNPTVTDANLVLGRLRTESFLHGKMPLDVDAAESALTPLAQTTGMTITELAEGIISIANEHMAQALRVISVQRGIDPREFPLVCFGGAGGLHLCDLAESLEMTTAIVPLNAGVLSALGMLTSQPGRRLVRTHAVKLEDTENQTLSELLESLRAEGEAELLAEGITHSTAVFSLDVRYLGQTATLNIPFQTIDQVDRAFHQEHEKRYGHRLDRAVELVNLRADLSADSKPFRLGTIEAGDGRYQEIELVGLGQTKLLDRESISGSQTGPALIKDPHTTILVKPGWAFSVDPGGSILMERFT